MKRGMPTRHSAAGIVAATCLFVRLGWSAALRQDTTVPISLPPVYVPPLGPVTGYVALSTNSVNSIDATHGTFAVDTYFYLSWRDDRYNPSLFNASVIGDLTSSSWVPAWQPLPEIVNTDIGQVSFSADPLNPTAFAFSVGSAPPWLVGWAPDAAQGLWVLGQSRQQVVLTATYQMQAFPFDSQTTGMFIESTTYESASLVWNCTPGCLNGIAPAGQATGPTSVISGWDITSTSAVYTITNYATFGQLYARLSMNINLQRQSQYYTDRFVFSVAMLVVIAIFGLFVGSGDAARLLIVQASFLGIVSWQFILVTSSPPLGYSTKLDNFMNISFAVVFGVYIWNATANGYRKKVAHVFSAHSSAPKIPSVAAEIEMSANPLASPGHGSPQSRAVTSGTRAGHSRSGVPPVAAVSGNHWMSQVRRCCHTNSPHNRLDIIAGAVACLVYVVMCTLVLKR